MPQRRPGLIAFVSCTFLTVSAAIRIMLWGMTPAGSGLKFHLLVKAAVAGFYFDLATLAYAILPLALYLILVPRRLATHRWHIWVLRALFTTFLAVLVFDVCAEYLFFDEFGTRFNFIAVDYLVYT